MDVSEGTGLDDSFCVLDDGGVFFACELSVDPTVDRGDHMRPKGWFEKSLVFFVKCVLGILITAAVFFMWSTMFVLLTVVTQTLLHFLNFVMFEKLSYVPLNYIFGFFLGSYMVLLYRPFKKPVLHESRFSRAVFSLIPVTGLYLYWIWLWVPFLKDRWDV